jgi:hypothetical protein
MAAQSHDRDSKNPSSTSGPPGKVVADALRDGSKAAPAGADRADDVTTPAEAFGEAKHATGKTAGTGTSPQVPGKAVAEALSKTGKR